MHSATTKNILRSIHILFLSRLAQWFL